jgi:hypothetical protein
MASGCGSNGLSRFFINSYLFDPYRTSIPSSAETEWRRVSRGVQAGKSAFDTPFALLQATQADFPPQGSKLGYLLSNNTNL